jgi:hypothetical protein
MKKTWLVLACFLVSAVALFGQNENDFRTKVENGTVTITSYTGAVKELNIPAKIDGKPVVAIGERAFFYNALTSVTIPNSVITIGNDAFQYNTLTSVTIPNSVITIGGGAFEHNDLESVTIPDSVISIGAGAFYENLLESVTIPHSVISIGARAFDNDVEVTQNERLIYGRTPMGLFYTLLNGTISIWDYDGTDKEVSIPERISGFPVTAIEQNAFYNKDLESVTIPGSVTTIGERAFQRNSLKSVRIPDGVTTIEGYAFSSNNLESVIISRSVAAINEQAFQRNFMTRATVPNLTAVVAANAFDGNVVITRDEQTGVVLADGSVQTFETRVENRQVTIVRYTGTAKQVSIPEIMEGSPVTAIGERAFYNNELTSVAIPSGVTSIGAWAFYNNALASVTLGDSVATIGERAFAYNALTSVAIPRSVATIAGWAFAYNALTSVTVPRSVSIGAWAFAQESDPESFLNDLADLYKSNDKRAGTYIYRNNDRLWALSNNTWEQALPVTLGVSVSGNPLSDISWYKLTVPSGGRQLTVSVEGNVDTLELYREPNRPSVNATGTNARAQVSIDVVEGSVIYIKVSSYGVNQGNYTLLTSM